MRLEGYEIVEEWPDRTWLARDADGTLVELVASIVRENERGEAASRLNRFRKLAHPALPRIIAVEGDPSVRSELIVVTEHRPRVSLARCARASEVGLAVALVCSVACSVARALADLHAARVVHGRVGPRTIAVASDGAVMLDFPQLLRTNAARDDVDALVKAMCALIAPSPAKPEPAHDDEDGEHDGFEDDLVMNEDIVSTSPMTAANHAAINALVAARPDVPGELIDVLRATLRDSPIDARGFADALASALPWTQWTPQNVVDEVRALVPG